MIKFIKVIALAGLLVLPLVSQASSGYKLQDPVRKLNIAAPANWTMNAGKYSVSMMHGTYTDAYVRLSKSWYTVGSADESYTKKKDSLKRSLPGAQFTQEKATVQLGTISGVSMTYKDPAKQQVHQVVLFIHNNVPYELSLKVKEANYNAVKADFEAILKNITPMQ